MKIAIIGVGAMGSVYVALLAEAGHDVWAVDPWQAHVKAINTNGLRVEGASGDQTITGITATIDVAKVGRVICVSSPPKPAKLAQPPARPTVSLVRTPWC